MAKRHSKTRRGPRSNPQGVLSVAASGYGFVQTAEGDFFIPSSKMAGAFDGDVVEVMPFTDGQRLRGASLARNQAGADTPMARVVRVLHRAHETVIGRLEVADPFAVVVPQDGRLTHDIFTMRSDNPDIADGSIVRVRMVQYPTRHQAATGVIEEVLGHANDVGVDVEMVIGKHQLETSFSEASLDEAHRADVGLDAALEQGYTDLRDRFVFTIDPVDARDFDDAISWERISDDRWRLGVHIADVSHYVEWGSSIDLDARRRATSVYLVDRVIPMLPEELSCDVCSLVPGKPRRAFTVDALVDGQGRVLRARFYPSIIESKARLSYDQAQCFIDAAHAGLGWAEALSSSARCDVPLDAPRPDDSVAVMLFDALSELDRFAKRRCGLRRDAGGIDFCTVEAKVKLDEDGEPAEVVLRKRTEATGLVEEAMLLANECAALKLLESQMPAVFRVHEAPDRDSMAAIVPVLKELGYSGDVDFRRFVEGEPRSVQAVLAKAEGRVEQSLVTQLVLRSMQRARYSESCSCHYALASRAYCHFTSPIRRYPDLVVHRMLKAAIWGKPATFEQQASSIGWLAEHASAMERIAEDAARETQEIKLVEYMGRFVGSVLPGTVVGVASYGVFVQLDNTAEGLVAVSDLGNERFSFDSGLFMLTGQESGAVFRLGQRMDVVIVAAPPHQRRLELGLFQGDK